MCIRDSARRFRLADIFGEPGVILAHIVAAIAQAEDGKLHPRVLKCLKINTAVVLRDIHAFFLHSCIPPQKLGGKGFTLILL